VPSVIEKPAQAKRDGRVDIRLPNETKKVIQRAARDKGMNTSDFIIAAAYDAAQETLVGREIMRLDAEQSRRVAAKLIEPGEPNEALKRLMRGGARARKKAR
jgi:Uncharacterized protein conserved in bacteria